MHWDAATRQKASSYALFLDLKNAFYRVIRQFAVSLPNDTDDVAEALRQCDLPQVLVEAAHSILESEQPVLEQHLDFSHLLALVRESQSGAFWKIEGGEGFERPRTGSRPGTILATDVFCLVFRRVHDFVDSHMNESGLVWRPLPADTRIASTEDYQNATSSVSFVDDMTIVNATPRADTVIRVTANTLDILYEAVSRHGMQLHADKTVAMIKFRHKGSKALALQLFSGDLPTITSAKWGITVKVVRDHKVLGVKVSQDGTMSAEIVARACSSRAALKPVRATIGPRVALSIKSKAVLSEALSASVLFSTRLRLGIRSLRAFKTRSEAPTRPSTELPLPCRELTMLSTSRLIGMCLTGCVAFRGTR